MVKQITWTRVSKNHESLDVDNEFHVSMDIKVLIEKTEMGKHR